MAADEACTVVLCGSTNQIIDELLRDALRTVPDGQDDLCRSRLRMLMNRTIDETTRKIKKKKTIAVEAFAHALRQILTIFAGNAGYDSSGLVISATFGREI